MVQYIPSPESWGTKIGKVLGELGGSYLQGQTENNKRQKMLGQQEDYYEKSGLPRSWASLPLEIQKNLIKTREAPAISEWLGKSLGNEEFSGSSTFSRAKESTPQQPNEVSIEELIASNPPQGEKGHNPEMPIWHKASSPPQGNLRAQGKEPRLPTHKNDITQLSDQELGLLASSPHEAHRRQAEAEIKLRESRRKENSSKERQILKLNEPKLVELNERKRNLEQTGLTFDRMKEILDTEGDAFPSSLSAALFDLEGEGGLSKLGRSQLSPAAQEYTKLVVNQLADAKNTFGSRLTNLDVQTYLKGLPGLLNTPEGRERLLNQLRTINQINQLHAQGIANEFEKAGGVDKIPYSQAESRANKAQFKEMKKLREQFVRPSAQNFSSLPEASSYKGVMIEDEETGQRFRSNGTEWEEV